MGKEALTSSEVAIIEATLALTAGLDVNQTCTAILDTADRIFSAHSCWVLLYDSEFDLLVTVECRGPSTTAYADARIRSDHGIVGLAFTRQEMVFVPDTTAEDRWHDPERVKRAGLRSVLTIPLVYERNALGVLGLDSPHYGR